VAESDRLQPRQRMAATGAAGADRQLVAHQIAAPVDEDRRPFDQARPLLLVAFGREPSDTAAVCRYAAEDRGPTVVSGVGRIRRSEQIPVTTEGRGE
jgi:hypothetical protein